MPSLVIQDGGASIIRAVRPEEFAPQAPGKLLAIGRGVYAFLPDPLPPRLEWSLRLIALLDEARGALGELAGLLRQLPNPYLFIRPFIQKEAVLSSRIEGTQAGLLDVYALEAQVPLFPSPKLREDAQEVLNYIRALERGMAFGIFPEGTRYKGEEGGAGEFKAGAFRIAVKTGAPVVPVAISGARGLFEAHGNRATPGTVYVRVLPPIRTAGMSRAEQKQLPDAVRQTILAEL